MLRGASPRQRRSDPLVHNADTVSRTTRDDGPREERGADYLNSGARGHSSSSAALHKRHSQKLWENVESSRRWKDTETFTRLRVFIKIAELRRSRLNVAIDLLSRIWAERPTSTFLDIHNGQL